MLRYELRDSVPGTPQWDKDKQFWMDAWLRSFRESKWAGVCPNHLFHDFHRMVIDNEVIERRGARITMITQPEMPDKFIGFICWEPGVLHYIYIKNSYRTLGLASLVTNQLLGRNFSYTFKTRAVEWANRSWKIKFEPKLVRSK